MSKKTIWYCTKCGSTDIEEKTWIAVNESKVIDGQLWYQYDSFCGDDEFYCQNCKDECDITYDYRGLIDEKPKKEDK